MLSRHVQLFLAVSLFGLLACGSPVADLQSINRNVPVYLQEEARRDWNGMNPTEAQFLQAAREARDAGAAGWVFHTDAGFELGTESFFAALDSVELRIVDRLAAEVFGP